MKHAVQSTFMLSALIILGGCGGGGSSDSPAPTTDKNAGGDVSGLPADGTVATVEPVDESEISSPDEIVLLAPGILSEDSYYERLQRQTNRAKNSFSGGDMTGDDRITESGSCPSGAGTVEVVGDLTLHYPGNPYTGAQFKEARVNYLNCEGVNWGDDAVNGRINISYPTTGIGSGDFDTEIDYVVSEQFGHDDDNPVVIQGPAQGEGIWTVSGMAHGHILRETNTDAWGYFGGKFSLNLKTTTEDFYGQDLTRIQWGHDVENFAYEAIPVGGSTSASYQEDYSGYYAKKVLKLAGNSIPDTCPQGGVNVDTTTPLSISYPLLNPKDKTIDSGTVVLTYGVSGKTATLTYDGANVTVVMDGGATSKVYTYAEVETLRMQRCGF